jgi:hypothetical protein
MTIVADRLSFCHAKQGTYRQGILNFTFNHLGVIYMTDSKTVAVAVKNYSKEQEDFLTNASPFDWDQAKIIGLAMDKSPQSIVAKVGNMGLEYTKKPVAVKKAAQTTKAELCAKVQKMLDRDMDGLEKASRNVLLLLINGIQHILPAEVEPVLPELGDSD